MRAAWGLLALVLLVGKPGVADAARLRTQYSGVVNLNEATAAELDLLPGVGDSAAQRIIQHRGKRPFQRVEELVRVKGFGRKKFLKLKAHLTLSGPTTLKVEQVASPPEGKEVVATNN
ncbi:ComEA family DNA-binding protein [Myxococcus qinghaiensis]|uniref:ComEA family DNA-binding protein n=1 Tax=Myxococcus qinghaiensis TaxID=2906758 RepID=UPI0020A6DFBA|nr:helix-hairpin-helix domain-containing protein [Myxococcus qinghaiensis]MCP3168467.1 helix-hairpin-helix domain-containing protein [Myxococcus qinghaiensis]